MAQIGPGLAQFCRGATHAVFATQPNGSSRITVPGGRTAAWNAATHTAAAEWSGTSVAVHTDQKAAYTRIALPRTSVHFANSRHAVPDSTTADPATFSFSVDATLTYVPGRTLTATHGGSSVTVELKHRAVAVSHAGNVVFATDAMQAAPAQVRLREAVDTVTGGVVRRRAVAMAPTGCTTYLSWIGCSTGGRYDRSADIGGGRAGGSLRAWDHRAGLFATIRMGDRTIDAGSSRTRALAFIDADNTVSCGLPGVSALLRPAGKGATLRTPAAQVAFPADGRTMSVTSTLGPRANLHSDGRAAIDLRARRSREGSSDRLRAELWPAGEFAINLDESSGVKVRLATYDQSTDTLTILTPDSRYVVRFALDVGEIVVSEASQELYRSSTSS